MFLLVDSDKWVRRPFRHCRKAPDRIVLAGSWDTKVPDTVVLERNMEFGSDRHRLVAPAADIDSEDRGNIRWPGLVDWDRPDYWNRDFLVALALGTGYSGTNPLRIAAAGFDKNHTVAERSLAWMDILVSSGHSDWDSCFADIHPFVRRKD